MQEPENRGAIDAENGERASRDRMVALGSTRDGGNCRSGRQEALNREDSFRELAQVRMRATSIAAHQRTNQLKTDNEEEKKHAEDFAGAALGEPTFDPGEDHSGEQNIYRRKQEQCEGGPWQKARRGHSDSCCYSQKPEGAEHRGRLERAGDNSDQGEGCVAQGKAEEIRGVKIFGERGGNNRKQLPEKKYRPEDRGEPL